MRRYLIALLVAFAVIGAFFGLLEWAMWRIQFYINNGVEIPLWERILFSIARLWGVFWPLPSLYIVATSLAVAGLVHFLQFVRASHNNTGHS